MSQSPAADSPKRPAVRKTKSQGWSWPHLVSVEMAKSSAKMAKPFTVSPSLHTPSLRAPSLHSLYEDEENGVSPTTMECRLPQERPLPLSPASSVDKDTDQLDKAKVFEDRDGNDYRHSDEESTTKSIHPEEQTSVSIAERIEMSKGVESTENVNTKHADGCGAPSSCVSVEGQANPTNSDCNEDCLDRWTHEECNENTCDHGEKISHQTTDLTTGPTAVDAQPERTQKPPEVLHSVRLGPDAKESESSLNHGGPPLKLNISSVSGETTDRKGEPLEDPALQEEAARAEEASNTKQPSPVGSPIIVRDFVKEHEKLPAAESCWLPPPRIFIQRASDATESGTPSPTPGASEPGHDVPRPASLAKRIVPDDPETPPTTEEKHRIRKTSVAIPSGILQEAPQDSEGLEEAKIPSTKEEGRYHRRQSVSLQYKGLELASQDMEGHEGPKTSSAKKERRHSSKQGVFMPHEVSHELSQHTKGPEEPKTQLTKEIDHQKASAATHGRLDERLKDPQRPEEPKTLTSGQEKLHQGREISTTANERLAETPLHQEPQEMPPAEKEKQHHGNANVATPSGRLDETSQDQGSPLAKKGKRDFRKVSIAIPPKRVVETSQNPESLETSAFSIEEPHTNRVSAALPHERLLETSQDPAEPKQTRTKKGKRGLRKARNLAMRKPILQMMLGKKLAAATKPVLRLLAQDKVSERTSVHTADAFIDLQKRTLTLQLPVDCPNISWERGRLLAVTSDAAVGIIGYFRQEGNP